MREMGWVITFLTLPPDPPPRPPPKPDMAEVTYRATPVVVELLPKGGLSGRWSNLRNLDPIWR